MSTSSHEGRRGRAIFPAPRGAAATVLTAFALVGCVGVGLAAQASTPSRNAPIKAGDELETPATSLPHLANPTGHEVRGEDVYGAGRFGASRGGGARRHRGADYVSEPGEIVRAPISGIVQRIGFAYRGDAHYQYVELGSADETRAARVLYVGPIVQLGTFVRAGEPIGWAQDLTIRYPRGITNHVHVEIKQDGVLADPAVLLPNADNAHS